MKVVAAVVNRDIVAMSCRDSGQWGGGVWGGGGEHRGAEGGVGGTVSGDAQWLLA